MVKIKRPVFFSGENPGMTLLVPETEQITAVASYWYCTDSPHGVGHALVLWLADETDAIGHGGVFTDNIELAKILVSNLTRYFPEFENVPVDTLKYVNAQCEHTYDGTSYQVKCQSTEARIELEWVEVLDRKQVNWRQFPAGDAAYDLTTVICPCGDGRIQVNDKRAAGEVQTLKADDGFFRSTAFLAFAETWIGPLGKEEKEN
jgi:hypothetical protein